MSQTEDVPQAAAKAPSAPVLRVDELELAIQRPGASGSLMRLRPPQAVTAAREQVLPVFEGWYSTADLVVRAAGVADAPFEASIAIGAAPVGKAALVELGSGAPVPFRFEVAVPLRLFGQHLGAPIALGLFVSCGAVSTSDPASVEAALSNRTARAVRLFWLTLAPLTGPGPLLAAVDLVDSTDALLFDAPERRHFDLQNPEEGFWFRSGKFRLKLVADWAPQQAANYSLDARPVRVEHAHRVACDATDLFFEDAGRRAGAGTRTTVELAFDSGHPALEPIPEEGKDVPTDVSVEHTLSFAVRSATVQATLAWAAALPIRVRDPKPLLKTFQRLSAVGIDFGTASSVAALYVKGYRSLLRLGGAREAASSAENPTYLLVEDHEKLWAEMARAAEAGARFPDLLRVVRGSHAAYDALVDVPSAVIGELKNLPERVMNLDQSPQLRDRERQRDFVLDEPRVRVLIRTYAYLLGRAINRPGQDVFLHYWLTHPAKFDAKTTKLLEEEIKAGLLHAIPEGIAASDISVSMSASEPEAFAAEVCPELAAHPALEPLVTQYGELRFVVLDLGGGTLDVACGRFRPATPEEQEATGSSTVIETLQVGGDDQLGGEFLTQELVWLTHQDEKHRPEMEEKEVPMDRPLTVPSNHLAEKPHLYKRSLAGRQNRVRFARELGLEKVKFGPEHAPRSTAELSAVRLDGTEVKVTSLGGDVSALHKKLQAHVLSRIRGGVKLMKSMLEIAPFGGESKSTDFREHGVVILLAGNSSRSAFVERALAEELGIPDLKVWRPDGATPFQHVVLYETPPRTERGVSIVGVTPKTAVALGALKIANQEVHLVRHSQGFSYFLGDLRGFPPKFHVLLPMGTPAGDPANPGPHVVEIGRWDSKMPLRISKEYVPNRMTSSDPRIVLVPSGLPPGAVGKLKVAVVSPEEVALLLERDGQEPIRTVVNVGKFMR